MENLPKDIAPFSCSHSSNTPELLNSLNCTIALSTYQAGKVIFISAINNQKIIQLPRSFEKAMGIATLNDKLGIACKDEVLILKNSPQLASHYPKKPNTYDGMFMPRVTFHTGNIDVHDLDFCDGGICAVNTNFSCIIKVDENHSFTPIWKPKFIEKIAPGDHCHLNGMAVENQKIKYVTAFAETDSPRAWTSTVATSGVLIDYATKEIVSRDLAMPHSPRIHEGKLYLLLSATGELVEVDLQSGKTNTVIKLDGFVRGLSFHQGYAFIGLSKIRKESSSFGHLSIADKSNKAGVAIVDLGSAKVVSYILYENSVNEIYDVQVLPGLKRPSILNTLNENYKTGIDIPDRTFWGKIVKKKSE